jgi:hypothetical protein
MEVRTDRTLDWFLTTPDAERRVSQSRCTGAGSIIFLLREILASRQPGGRWLRQTHRHQVRQNIIQTGVALRAKTLQPILRITADLFRPRSPQPVAGHRRPWGFDSGLFTQKPPLGVAIDIVWNHLIGSRISGRRIFGMTRTPFDPSAGGIQNSTMPST